MCRQDPSSQGSQGSPCPPSIKSLARKLLSLQFRFQESLQHIHFSREDAILNPSPGILHVFSALVLRGKRGKQLDPIQIHLLPSFFLASLSREVGPPPGSSVTRLLPTSPRQAHRTQAGRMCETGSREPRTYPGEVGGRGTRSELTAQAPNVCTIVSTYFIYK